MNRDDILKRKYNNKKCEYNNIKFDSIKEMNRYIQLKEMEDNKEISNLKRQVKYELQSSFIDGENKSHRSINYICDFQYEMNGRLIVEDVKSKVTMNDSTFKLKQKLFAMKYYPLVISIYL